MSLRAGVSCVRSQSCAAFSLLLLLRLRLLDRPGESPLHSIAVSMLSAFVAGIPALGFWDAGMAFVSYARILFTAPTLNGKKISPPEGNSSI